MDKLGRCRSTASSVAILETCCPARPRDLGHRIYHVAAPEFGDDSFYDDAGSLNTIDRALFPSFGVPVVQLGRPRPCIRALTTTVRGLHFVVFKRSRAAFKKIEQKVCGPEPGKPFSLDGG